jgi:hypothetical protein
MSYIKQLRWKYPTNEDISPEIGDQFFDINLVQKVLGSKSYIRELGILAKAGTPFMINGNPLTIGPAECYELNSLQITSLVFPQEGNKNNARIIIDMVYE